MMNELAPHTKDGSYARPTYTFSSAIGTAESPVRLLADLMLTLASLAASACALGTAHAAYGMQPR